MFHASKHHADQKKLFIEGYNRMLKEIEPSKIICYSEPFEEMQGDIIYIDYELSSWQHLSDDKSSFAVKPYERDVIVKYSGYVCKGGGSASGGDWIPKKPNDERFLGEPNTIKNNTVTTKNGNYKVEDYYDSTGKAVAERHLTNHNRSDKHSVPHDHFIDWKKGYPDPQPPMNYPNNPAPAFIDFIKENFENLIIGDEKSMYTKDANYEYNPDDYKFETLGEFKIYLDSGWNVGFEYNGIEYGIEGHYNSFDIWIYDKCDIANGLTLEEVLDYKLDGVKIRDLILDAEITERLA